MSQLTLEEAWEQYCKDYNKDNTLGSSSKEMFFEGWQEAEKDAGQSGLIRGLGPYCFGWNAYVRNSK